MARVEWRYDWFNQPFFYYQCAERSEEKPAHSNTGGTEISKGRCRVAPNAATGSGV
jgi:hypothetical protein